MRRVLLLTGLVLFGVAAGVTYGRFVAPVEYVDTTPSSLRIDYRTDYVLMVAEAFHADRDAGAARRQLAVLGADSAAAACAEALDFARLSAYSQQDVLIMEELREAMRALEAADSVPGAAP